MITVPVLSDFNQDKAIGYLTIDEKFLPSTPNYHFALGCKILDKKYEKYELVCISIVPDYIFKVNNGN